MKETIMTNHMQRNILLAVAGIGLFFSGWAVGKEKFATERSMVHFAAWTAKDGLTQAELDAFKSSLTKLPDMFPGLERVWVGKLGAEVTANGEKRNYAIALQFQDYKSKLAYSSSPRREEWLTMFETVRKPGSTSFDLIGE
jgi:antibiotic biosynthesis monooxygenase (ABM) superfamily enzyme